jgi:fructose-1,6-bisphosphatase/inositol monophosphatase family enzyme
MSIPLPGAQNGHTAGIVMKEAVRRAIIAIRRQFRTFEAQEKLGVNKVEDFVTSADKAAQQLYIKTLRECFPGYGIVAEEDDLQEPCRMQGEDIFFTIDPLDGTKAFMRRQSHAIGTMISLVRDGHVIGAYVGDVMTQEIYGFRPGSKYVHRISEYNEPERLMVNQKPLSEHYVSLRNEPLTYSAAVQKIACGKAFGGLFDGMQVAGGSIGVDVARLWKGEIGAVVLEPFTNTPWDYCPVMGISQKLGFVEVEVEGERLVPTEPLYLPTHVRRDKEALLVHRSNLPELGLSS